jgi:hypothetical protein
MFVRAMFFMTMLWVGTLCPSVAFPQYADWITEKSGRQVDCAYCHINAEGPQGTGPGQIGSIKDDDLPKLRTAESPILNAFGKSIIKHVGYAGVAEGMMDPSSVAQKLKAFDMDGDGISDGVEMEFATLPSDPLSAPPHLLWQKRLEKNMPFVLLIGVCGIAGAIALFMLSKHLSKTDAAKTTESTTPDDAAR